MFQRQVHGSTFVGKCVDFGNPMLKMRPILADSSYYIHIFKTINASNANFEVIVFKKSNLILLHSVFLFKIIKIPQRAYTASKARILIISAYITAYFGLLQLFKKEEQEIEGIWNEDALEKPFDFNDWWTRSCLCSFRVFSESNVDSVHI